MTSLQDNREETDATKPVGLRRSRPWVAHYQPELRRNTSVVTASGPCRRWFEADARAVCRASSVKIC